jgi:chorismate mutase / prephenate dehydratase
MTDDKLKDIRDKLDSVDIELQNLLTRRAQISLEVKEIKKTDKTKLKPGREAQIIRALIERHNGNFPMLELVSIWREILSASVKLQGTFTLAVYKTETGSDENWGYIASARGHFGSQTPIITYPSQRRVVEAVLENECSIGILPIPIRNENNPWWRHLAVQGNTVKNGGASKPARIIAKLPFAAPKIEYGQFGTGSTECVVISKSEADASGLDDTYIVLDLTENIPDTRIDTRLAENNMNGSTVSIWHDAEAPERWLCLICIKGFILSNDNKLDRLTEGFNKILNQVTILGSYAVPLDAKTLGLNNSSKRD